MVLLTISVVALAQEAPEASNTKASATVRAGVPLRVALEHRVAIKRLGEPIQGRLVEPLYVFDRLVLQAGSVVEGRVAEIGRVPASRRFTAILSGNFTPAREVRAQFDTLVLTDGSRLPLHTSFSAGTAHTMRVSAQKNKHGEHKSALKGAQAGLEEIDRAAIRAFTAPGKMSRLKSTLLGMLPYQRQTWSAGTLFSAVLQEPLSAPALNHVEAPTVNAAVAEPQAFELNARLLTTISSATATRGAPVEAVVTRPLFSANHSLLIPEGSLLLGDVVQTQPARSFHRNGKLLFVFRQIKPPAGAAQRIQGHLEGVEADFDAHLSLDSEGATRANSPSTRFIFPAVAVAVSALSFHQDYNAKGVPDQDIGGRAESGAVGLGLIGTVVAQASRTLASSIAITGAAFSVYSNFIARGEVVVLPASTPIRVGLSPRGGEVGTQPVKRSFHE
jgi:hypothetical protein